MHIINYKTQIILEFLEEIRLGSLVEKSIKSGSSTEKQKTCLKKHDMARIYSEECHFVYEPCLLDEIILDCFGFKGGNVKIKQHKNFAFKIIDDLLIVLKEDEIENLQTIWIEGVKYAHKLQNIFADFTKTKLTLNEYDLL